MSKRKKLTKADEEWWIQRHEQKTGVHCRWSPDLNTSDVLFVRDPDNLSPRALYHTRMLLNMLIESGDLTRARKITNAHVQLREEYAERIETRAKSRL